ncbi:hypothetical protein DKX38_030115 (mitochondrion) [Salix brachista]|uniref:Uncharacterized protein n=1 Tax=Salix brachista TaxID=2182728 RepID=A0A5N5IZ80_9ROSI|nr:hypothetical protein DKX38_030115 [Salix brachista]
MLGFLDSGEMHLLEMERQNCSPIAVLGGSLEKPKPILSIDKVRRKGPDGMGLLPLLRMPNFFSLMLLNLKSKVPVGGQMKKECFFLATGNRIDLVKLVYYLSIRYESRRGRGAYERRDKSSFPSPPSKNRLKLKLEQLLLSHRILVKRWAFSSDLCINRNAGKASSRDSGARRSFLRQGKRSSIQCLLLTLIPRSPFLKHLPFLQMLKMLPAVVDASAAIIDLSFEVPSSGCPILVVRYPQAISSVPPIPGLHPYFRWEYKQVSKLAELAAFPATKYPYFFHLQFSKRFRGCVTAVRTLFLIRYGCRKVKIGSVPGHGDMLDKAEERRLSEPTDLLADTRADSILRSEPWSSNLLKRLDRMTGSYSIPSFPSCASVRLCGRKP